MDLPKIGDIIETENKSQARLIYDQKDDILYARIIITEDNKFILANMKTEQRSGLKAIITGKTRARWLNKFKKGIQENTSAIKIIRKSQSGRSVLVELIYEN